jgi:hypothetical protein
MQALAITKASVAWQREKESQEQNQKKISETGRRNNTVKNAYPRKLEQFSGTRRIQCPKKQTSSSKSIKGKYEYKSQTSQRTSRKEKSTHIITRSHRSMGIKRSANHSRFL